MEKGTKILLGITALVGVGTFVYFVTKKFKQAKSKANLFTFSALDKRTNTFSVYPHLTKKRIIVKRNKEINKDSTSKTSDRMKKQYKYMPFDAYKVGDVVAIKGGGNLNGMYKVKSKTYDSGQGKGVLAGLKLINNGWDGSVGSNFYVSKSKTRIRPLNSAEVPTIEVVK